MNVMVDNSAKYSEESTIEAVVSILRRLLTQAKKDRVTGRLALDIVLRQGGIARTFSERETKEEGCSVRLHNQEK